MKLRVLANTQDVGLSLDASEQIVPCQLHISASVITQLFTERARLPIQMQFTQVLDALRAQVRDNYLARWNQETQARRQAVVYQYEQLAPMREAIRRITEKISETRKQLRKIDDMSVSIIKVMMHGLRREDLRDLQRELQAVQRAASSEEIKSLESMVEALQAKIHSEQTGQSSSLHALKSEARTLIERKIRRLDHQEEQFQVQYRESEDYAQYLARIRARNAIDLSTPRQGSQHNFNRALQSLYDHLAAQLNWPDLRAEKLFAEMLLTLSDLKELEHMFSQDSTNGVSRDEILTLHRWAKANISYLERLGRLRTASDGDPVALYYDDIAPLLSLQAMLAETDRESLTTKSTLVDEAQDRTPLELWLLAQYSQTEWFALVGDLAQKLNIRLGILELGIVCKDHSEASLVYKGLVKVEVYDVNEITDATLTISTGVSVLPIALAKGLEFPWVIMPNVSAKQFSTVQDCYLLYIGITRALHGISLLSLGKFSHFFGYYSA